LAQYAELTSIKPAKPAHPIKRLYRFLYLLPIAIMIISTAFFAALINGIQDSLLNEKFAEKKLQVTMMANRTNSLISMSKDWEKNRSYYLTGLALNCETIDSTYMTYSQVFDTDLTPRSVETDNVGGFNPLDYPDFKSAVNQNEIGDMVIYTADGRDMYLHYRWIPTDTSLKNRFLVTVAISKETILTKTASWYQWGAALLIIITTVLNFFMVNAISRRRGVKIPDA